MSDEVVKKAKKLIEEVVIGDLATVEQGRPRVRPMAMKWVGERELWFATYAASRKVVQINSNAAVEVCFHDGEWSHVRLSGRASTTQDDAPRKEFWGMVKELGDYFSGPTDPDFTLVKIALERIEYMSAGAHEYQTHDF